MAFLTHTGVSTFDENVFVVETAIARTTIAINPSLTLRTKSSSALSTTIELPATLDFKSDKTFSIETTIELPATLSSFVKRLVPSTSKLSAYTVLPQIINHQDQANDNLITQFQDCPNIYKYLGATLSVLDTIQQDLEDFQEKIINIEEAEGVQLDNIGTLLGLDRRSLTDSDSFFRVQLVGKVFANISDGTTHAITNALLSSYNLAQNEDSYNEVKVTTGRQGEVMVFVRDQGYIEENGGKAYIKSLTAAGASTKIKVANGTTARGNSFKWSSRYYTRRLRLRCLDPRLGQ